VEFKDASRAQTSLLAPIEKRCLIWLAEWMPAWVSSDHLTLLGFLAMLMAGLGYWLARWDRLWLLVVILLLAVNWFGDSLDGTVARVRKKLRPRYGFYVDHVVDAVGTLGLLAGMGASSYMSPWVAASVLVAYLLISIEVYLSTYTIGTFHLSHWKMSPTELRILLAIGNIVVLFRPTVHIAGRTYLLFDVGGVVGAVGLVLMFSVTAWKHTRFLYNEEKI